VKNFTLSRTRAFPAIILFLFTALASCNSGKQLAYFRNLPDSTIIHLPLIPQEERVAENGDRLDITIGAKDPEAANFFNKGSGGSAGSATGESGGYLVDYDGNTEFPIIGKINARARTAKQLKENLTRMVTPYLKDPIIEVRFTSFRVSVLGEVRGPGAFMLNSQRTTILDALAAAGDLPHSAKRYDVSIIRDYNGQRTITKIDLRKKDVLYNPDVFQLKHNDVIYVQPRNKTIFTEDMGLFTTIFSLVIGLFAVVFTIVKN
jgi:polysaccharide export outer membrane protein